MKTSAARSTMAAGEARGISPGIEELDAVVGHTHAMVSVEVSSDLETPVSAFIKLRRSPEEPCFLLESAESGRMWGRYSILGFAPEVIARVDGSELTLSSAVGETVAVEGNPVEALFGMLAEADVFMADATGTLYDPLPFEGGAVGYFGYGTLAQLEKVSLTKGPGVPGIPDAMFMFPRRMVIFDHLRSRMRLCVLADLPEARMGEDVYLQAVAELGEMEQSIRDSLPTSVGLALGGFTGGPDEDFVSTRSNVTREEFEDMVRRAREHIFAGDAFQVVVSQRLSMEFEGDPLSIYRHLRAENPSPYMFLIQLPEVTLVGSSPEPLVTNRGGRAVIRPIAGTRPRGADSDADAALADELASDA
ncbi:MAG: chorismate-binding protein, partial [Candidatus Geothermincolia bacterium]